MGERIQSKWICGPGGLNCPCCQTGTKKEAKKGVSKDRRRQGKDEIRREMNGAD